MAAHLSSIVNLCRQTEMRLTPVSIVALAVAAPSCGSAARNEDHPGAGSGPGPREVVNEYIRRDLAGEFTEQSAWLDSLALFLVPGADMAVIVRSASADSGRVASDTGTVRVTYQGVAIIGGDGNGNARVQRADTTELVDFILVREEGRWRLLSPAFEPHISIETVLRNPGLTADQRRLLQGMK